MNDFKAPEHFYPFSVMGSVLSSSIRMLIHNKAPNEDYRSEEHFQKTYIKLSYTLLTVCTHTGLSGGVGRPQSDIGAVRDGQLRLLVGDMGKAAATGEPDGGSLQQGCGSALISSVSGSGSSILG